MFSLKEKINNLSPIPHRKLYTGLVLGFFLKAIGAAWDASYHFKFFRELYQLPHILNGFGDLIIVVLLFYLWFREPKQDKPQLRIILYGMLVFIAGALFDQWSHEKFGIDLTAWSPSHFMLYIGTFISLLGAFLYVLRDYKHGRISLQVKKWFSLAFSYLILDSFWFPLLQHEQGAILDYALKHGVTNLIDADLFDMVIRTQGNVYSDLPAWLYGAWVVFAVVIVFQFVKRINVHKYGATIVAGIYLLQRLILNIFFSAGDYPTSVLPFYLILMAFLFDILYNKFEKQTLTRNIVTSLVPVVIIIGVGLLNPELPIHPPIPALQTLLYAIPAAILGCILSTSLYRLFSKQCAKEEKEKSFSQ